MRGGDSGQKRLPTPLGVSRLIGLDVAVHEVTQPIDDVAVSVLAAVLVRIRPTILAHVFSFPESAFSPLRVLRWNADVPPPRGAWLWNTATAWNGAGHGATNTLENGQMPLVALRSRLGGT
jgi:hypothetical protein